MNTYITQQRKEATKKYFKVIFSTWTLLYILTQLIHKFLQRRIWQKIKHITKNVLCLPCKRRSNSKSIQIRFSTYQCYFLQHWSKVKTQCEKSRKIFKWKIFREKGYGWIQKVDFTLEICRQWGRCGNYISLLFTLLKDEKFTLTEKIFRKIN